MSKTNNLTDFLTDEANAIRAKKGYPSSQKINPQDFAQEIETIETPNLQEKTVSPTAPSQIVKPDAPYNGLSQVTVNGAPLQNKTVTPSAASQAVNKDLGYYGLGTVTVNGDSNLTAENIKNNVSIFGVKGTYAPPLQEGKTVTPGVSPQRVIADEGYYGLAEVVVEGISPTKGAQTYTPGRTNQTIPSGRWLTGAQTIQGDANLLPQNIKKGVGIFNVLGTFEGAAQPTITTRSYTLTTEDVISFTNSEAIAQIIFVTPEPASQEIDELLYLSVYGTDGSRTTMTYSTSRPRLNAVCVLNNGKVYTQTIDENTLPESFVHTYDSINFIELEAGSMSSPAIPLQIIEIK